MQQRTLPGTDLHVSEVCLGTMTFGQQNSEDEAHAQLDHARGAGINFIDTAEMYPVPPTRARRDAPRRSSATGCKISRAPNSSSPRRSQVRDAASGSAADAPT